jgi:hydrogenase maturation protease
MSQHPTQNSTAFGFFLTWNPYCFFPVSCRGVGSDVPGASARPGLATLCDIAMPGSPVLVIGIGNRLRGDDSASGEVVRRLHERGSQTGIELSEHLCEPSDLLDAMQGRDAVVLVDTMRSGDPPGTIRRFDASSEPLPARLRGSASTHAFGLHEAIELARALHRLPQRVIVLAVEGRHFEAGATLSGEVEAAVAPLACAVLRAARELANN